MKLNELRRLMDVDASLASREGLHVADCAKRHSVSSKTIRRDIELLGELVGPTEDRMVAADNAPGRSWRHFYVDRRRRLFSSREEPKR